MNPQDPAQRLEWLGLAGLVILTLGVWLLQFEPFDLPNNDYASFEATARAFAAGELPARYQRMPIFPGLMAVVAPFCPGPHPYLSAALILNLLFSLALLVALYDLAERLLGRGALLVPALFAAGNQFHTMGLQPLVEPSLGFFVVLAFALCARRSRWQYAAAGAAALSRYEAAPLLGVLALINAIGDRDIRRHFALAAVAGLPFVAWLGLGATQGSGASWYLDMMEDSDFSAAPHFLVTSLKEPLRGWLGSGALGWAIFTIAAGIPIVLGAAASVRRHPRETAGILLIFVLATTTIVVFGIDKGRYAYAYQWIPIFFLAAGLLKLLGAGTLARIAQLPRMALWALTVLVAAGLLATLRNGIHRLGEVHPGALPVVDELWVLAALAAIVLALALRVRGTGTEFRHAAGLVCLAALLVALPVVTEGMRVKRKEQYKVHWGNHGIVLASDWIGEHSAPDDRFVVLHKRHYLHQTGLPAERFSSLMNLDATSLEELAPKMRERGLTHLIVTWRKPPGQRDDRRMEQKFKWFLVAPLLEGEAAPGMSRVASLALPDHMERPPVRIFRVDPADAGTLRESSMKPAFARSRAGG